MGIGDLGSGIKKIQIRDGKHSYPGWKTFGSGMENIRIRDGKHSYPGWKKF
jgi:hypothetical protein